jgi:DNA-binding transcriptional regulator YiaG
LVYPTTPTYVDGLKIIENQEKLDWEITEGKSQSPFKGRPRTKPMSFVFGRLNLSHFYTFDRIKMSHPISNSINPSYDRSDQTTTKERTNSMIEMAQFHNIKFIKEVEGLSQRQIAVKLGISQNTVKKYLERNTAPTTVLRKKVYGTI